MMTFACGVCSRRLLHAAAVMAGLGCASISAWADSAQGVDTLLGSGLNPDGLDPTVPAGKSAAGSFRPGGSHTPTGTRYLSPPEYPEPVLGANGWAYNASLEAGFWGLNGNEANALFRQYRDWNNGLAVNWFSLNAEKDADASYLLLFGGNVGRRDAFYGLETGRYNGFKVKAFINQIPHALGGGSTYFQGAGSDYLKLPSSITPGAGSLSAIDAAALSGEWVDFKVQRNRAGLRGDWLISDAWKAYTSYTYEKRDGMRQMGGSFFFPIGLGPTLTVGGMSEIIEPIDYQTHDVAAGLQYAQGLTHFNLALTASLFRNANAALTWENPYNVGALVGTNPNPYAANVQRGQMALSPDSQAYNVKAEYARAIPEWHKAHLSASIALGRMTQDDDLLAPTVNSGIGGNGTVTWNNADWNTTAALSRRSAGARIDTTLVNMQFSMAPMDAWTLRAKARYYQTRNHTDYTAYNPITGQYGYLALGGGQGTVVPGESGIASPTSEAVHYRSIPFDGTQQNLGVDADYRLNAKTTLAGSYERENYLRHHRERARTWEDKLKFSVITRALSEGSLRASFEYDRRGGSAYDYDPYGAFYSDSLPGATASAVPHTLADLRKYDIGDRNQQILNLRYNQPLREDLDVGLTLQQKLIDWGGEFGRVDRQYQTSVNVDLNWTPVDGTTGYAYYSHDRGRVSQASVNDNAANLAGSANYGGNVYLSNNAWAATSRDRADVLGLGMKKAFARHMALDVGYTLTRSTTAISYSYLDAGGAVLGSPGSVLPSVGNAFPDMTYRLQSLQASLAGQVTKSLGWRIVARYDHMSIRDWHYEGLQPGLLPANGTGTLLPASFIDLGPKGYNATVLGVFLQYRL